jgi:Uncharacterized protein conserved in bacteria (DUF2334)
MKKHRVILRDDDTSALTPVDCLERLYRPWLDLGLPVNLATIPFVNTSARWKDGSEEGFLFAKQGNEPSHLSIAANGGLLAYLNSNEGYRIVHHGYAHDYLEFDAKDGRKIGQLLDAGRKCFEDAGLNAPRSFVAPYDQISRAALMEVSKRFDVLSTGWFELKKLPLHWWPRYFMKKARKETHWSCGSLQMLSHPGCLLSHKRDPKTILDLVQRAVLSQSLTVLVTHWWEYFHGGKTNEAYVAALHETAAWLASREDIEVVGFDDLLRTSATQAAGTQRALNTLKPSLGSPLS